MTRLNDSAGEQLNMALQKIQLGFLGLAGLMVMYSEMDKKHKRKIKMVTIKLLVQWIKKK